MHSSLCSRSWCSLATSSCVTAYCSLHTNSQLCQHLLNSRNLYLMCLLFLLPRNNSLVVLFRDKYVTRQIVALVVQGQADGWIGQSDRLASRNISLVRKVFSSFGVSSEVCTSNRFGWQKRKMFCCR